MRTTINTSPIHGIGLFADQDIAEGVKVWEYLPLFDIAVDAEKLSLLSEPAKTQFLSYTYLHAPSNQYILCFDDARFFNHSDSPNCVDTPVAGGATVAARDIRKGEELTCDYKMFDAGFRSKIPAKHALPPTPSRVK